MFAHHAYNFHKEGLKIRNCTLEGKQLGKFSFRIFYSNTKCYVTFVITNAKFATSTNGKYTYKVLHN